MNLCAASTLAGTHLQPPEFCENEVVEGEEYCTWHDVEGHAADKADDERDWRKGGF